MSIRDTRLIEKALRERWPIKPEFREKITYSLIAVIADKNSPARAKIAAARALMYADSLNLEAEKIAQADWQHEEKLDADRMDRISSVAKHLGLTRVVEAIAARRPGSDIIRDDASNHNQDD